MIAVFSVFLLYAMAKGRYSLINVIFSLYMALLISLKFPYYNELAGGSGESSAVARILIFLGFVIAGIILFRRHVPGDDYEPAFFKLGTKIILAGMATEIITPGTPIQSLFASQENFFWWLILPIIVLFFV
jgi:hypothetical protein